MAKALANDGQRDSAIPHAVKRRRQRRVRGELPGNRNDVAVLQEHQPAGAVVVGERAERLGSQGDLRVELQRRVEQRQSSVHAAHAVDRDLLDQQLFLDDVVANWSALRQSRTSTISSFSMGRA